ncbi:hypothetical protein P8452_47152 [Trifolium repens]|nr:hypothetical protein P8452_47152 [Trifolium repens]
MLKWDIRDTDIEKLKDKWISYADKNIVLIVDSAINSYKMLKGSRKQRKPTWNIILTCQRQSFSYESGYYVMIHMLNIVSAGIVNPWNQHVNYKYGMCIVLEISLANAISSAPNVS